MPNFRHLCRRTQKKTLIPWVAGVPFLQSCETVGSLSVPSIQPNAACDSCLNFRNRIRVYVKKLALFRSKVGPEVRSPFGTVLESTCCLKNAQIRPKFGRTWSGMRPNFSLKSCARYMTPSRKEIGVQRKKNSRKGQVGSCGPQRLTSWLRTELMGLIKWENENNPKTMNSL